jgi:hypothetical protein
MKNNLIASTLAPYLDAKSKDLLAKHNIKPEQYILFAYDHALKKTERIGYIITGVLFVVLFTLGFGAGREVAIEHLITNPLFPYGTALATGALGFLIGYLSVRHMRGQQSKYVEYPDSTEGGFILIDILEALKANHIKTLSPETIEQIQTFSPDLSSKRFQALPGAHRAQTCELSDHCKDVIEKIAKAKKVAAWLLLPGILFVFGETLFFIFWAWFFAGIWLLLDIIVGFIKKETRVMGDGGQTMVFKGWPATFFNIVLTIVAVLIFIIPGLIGMITEAL